MAKQVPVIPSGFPCTLEAILAANDFPIESWVWPQSAKRQEAAGKLRALKDSNGVIVAWHRIGPNRKVPGWTEDGHKLPLMDRSDCSISPSEMNAYAGRHFKNGGSRTAGLSEKQRAERKFSERPLTEAEILAGRRQKFGTPPAEDFVERVVAKVNAFEPSRAEV